jgi:ATP-dependent DNA ligase
LEQIFARWGGQKGLMLSPASRDRAVAEHWMVELAASGLDGIIAKRIREPYRSGERTAMMKIKRIRTADCVVGGFRYAQSGGEVGSLLLGLYDEEGKLDHVGFAASFTREERPKLKPIVEPLIEPPGFTGSAPGGPSRWTTERSTEWKPLRPTLVCEVRYDHFSGGRFRHGTKFLRWRPDKAPRQCTFDQVLPPTGPRPSLLLP